MALYLSPFASFLQVLSDAGLVTPGLLMWTYAAGTSTPTNTWTDISGTVLNSNPIQLNAAGRLPNVSVWQQGGVPIKIQFSMNAGTVGAPLFGQQIGPTFDQVSGINDPAATLASLANPASGSGVDLVANAMRSYDLIASVRAANVPSLAAGQTLVIDIEGAITVTDAGGGLFYWNATSTAADDGINVLAVTANGANPGRFLRQTQTILTAVKSANTTRASTTTAIADPDLQIPLTAAAGTYGFTLWINDYNGSTSGGGLKGTMVYSGSSSNGFWGMQGTGTGVTNVGLVTVGVVAQEMESSQNGQGSMLITGSVVTTSPGTLSFQWAQHSSNSTASFVGVGSWMTVNRLA